MPTMPDFTSLGGIRNAEGKLPFIVPSERPNDPINAVKLNADQVISDAARSGEGLKKLSEGINQVSTDAFALARQNFEEKLKVQTAQADAAWMPYRVDRLNQYQNDPDYDTAPKRFITEAPEQIEKHANQFISDPQARDMWILKAKEDTARDYHTVLLSSQTKQNNAQSALGTQSIDNLSKTFVEASNRQDKEMMNQSRSAVENLIDANIAKGIWSPEVGERIRREYTNNTTKGSFLSQDPEKRMALTGGFERAMIYRESGNNPAIQNQFGYSGLYQFGAPRLADMGVYKPGADENLKTWSKTDKTTAGKWSGVFDIPGFPQVKTINDFLSSPEAQKKAFDMHIKDIDADIYKMGLDKYIGTTVQGVLITKEGIEAMAHLGGMGGAKAVLTGQYYPPDANGTPLIQYAKLGIGGKSGSALADNLTPDDRVSLFDGAVKDWDQQKRVVAIQDKASLEQAAGGYLDKMMKNQFNNIENDITNDPILSKDKQTQWSLLQTAQRELAASDKGEAKTFGSCYAQSLQDVADNKLVNLSDVVKLGASGQLSSQGMNAIGVAIQRMKKDAYSSGTISTLNSQVQYAKKQLSFEDLTMPYLKDPVGESIFLSQFVPKFHQEYEKWVEAGKNPYEFLQKENVDKMIAGMRDPTEMRRSKVAAGQQVSSSSSTQTSISVKAPNGKTYIFKDQASADAFRKQAGL